MNKLINFYRIIITPIFLALGLGSKCAFYPTCSEYSRQAFQKFNFLKATFLTTRRVLRCHPWQKNHLDPI